jgi:hypothetical protein
MGPHLPFVGMAKEKHRLNLALSTGDPLLPLGPQGSGKTRVIQEALSSDSQVLYIPWAPTSHELVTAMARALIAARHAGFINPGFISPGFVSMAKPAPIRVLIRPLIRMPGSRIKPVCVSKG